MDERKLFLTFWNIGLDNLPVGEFVHSQLTLEEAKHLIEEYRKKDNLVCVARDDLLAPYKKDKLSNYEKLCEALGKFCGIEISIEEFASTHEFDGEKVITINPLDFIQVSEGVNLMVITCAYTIDKMDKASLTFNSSVAEGSIEFHLIAVNQLNA